MTTFFRIGAAALLVAAIEAPCASAQETEAPLDAVLTSYLSREVRVSDAGGMILDGAIAAIHDGQLEMLTRGGVRSLPLDGIIRIERRGDSVKNGFIVGAAFGGIMGASMMALGGADNAGWAAYGMLWAAGTWGLVGAGIDALHTGWTPLYVRKDKRPQPGGGSRALISLRLRF